MRFSKRIKITTTMYPNQKLKNPKTKRKSGKEEEEMTTTDIEQLKTQIENFDKIHQIEILRIIKDSNVTINENKSGVFINLSLVPQEYIEQIKLYIDYVSLLENQLKVTEEEKTHIKNNCFKKYTTPTTSQSILIVENQK